MKPCNGVSSRETLLKRLPILDWLPRYSLEMLGGDLIAGVSVGLTVIPQSIAYGLLAELPPEVMVTFLNQ